MNPSPRASHAFAAASYNIHRCVGTDGRQEPERIARMLRQLDATVIGLQEVECQYEGEWGCHQLHFLAEATGMRVVAGSTILRSDADYGNALLTRAPILAVRRHDLSVPGREPRAALDVDLDVGGGELRVVVSHLGLQSCERRMQTRRLLEVLESHDDTPILLMADINEWFGWGRALRWLNRRLGRSPRIATFPARNPLFALDRIWLAPPQMLVGVEAINTPLARLASDHLPLRALIDLSVGAGRIPWHKQDK